MPLVIPENGHELIFVHNQNGTQRQAITTIGMLYEGADFESDVVLIGGKYTSTVMTVLCNQITLVSFKWRNALGSEGEVPLAVVGGNTNGCAPYSNAYLVKKITSLPGRRGHGRMYLPGVEENNVDPAGNLAAGIKADIQAELDSFLDEFVLRNSLPVLFHNEVAAPGVTPAPSTITKLALDSRTATQRKRLRR